MAHETPTAPGRDLDLLKLLVSAESLSREEFPKVLKGLGLASKPNAVKEEAGLPAKVDDRLTSLDFLEVLLAVHDVHEAIEDDGESPSRLGALARGYALLGVLSEFQWHPAHRAFKGRALLYAQRMIARNPDQAVGSVEPCFRPGDSWAGIAMHSPTSTRRKRKQKSKARRAAPGLGRGR